MEKKKHNQDYFGWYWNHDYSIDFFEFENMMRLFLISKKKHFVTENFEFSLKIENIKTKNYVQICIQLFCNCYKTVNE